MSPIVSLTSRLALATARLRHALVEAATQDALAALDARTRHDLGLPPSMSRPADRFYL
jgi:hypothetical protein